MVKLFKPQENVIQSRAGISGSAAQAPGIAQASAGQEVEALGKQYFQEAKRANQATMLSNALTGAKEEYMTNANERMSQSVDENGMPTHEQMISDVGTIGEEARKNASMFIADPEVRAQFDMAFNQFDTQQKIQAFSAARKQSSSWRLASYNENKDKWRESAATDPTKVNSAHSDGQLHLDRLLAAGDLSPAQHQDESTKLRSELYTTAWSASIGNDPTGARDRLEGSTASALGLKESERQHYLNVAEAAVEDEQHEAEKMVKQASADLASGQKQLAESFSTRIAEEATGVETKPLTQQEIVASESLLGPHYKTVLRQHAALTTQQNAKTAKISEMSSALQNKGSFILNTDKEIRTYHQARIKSIEERTGQKATLEDEVTLANTYGAPANFLAKQVNQGLLRGSMESKQKAFEGYMAGTGPRKATFNGSGLSEEARRIAELTRTRMETGDDFQTAYADAKETLEARKAEQGGITREQFIASQGSVVSKSEYHPEKIEEHMNNLLNLESSIFGINVDIPKDIRERFTTRVWDEYNQNGEDIDAAERVAVSAFNSTNFGLSSLTGKEEFTLHPPEAVTGLPTEEIRRQIKSDIINSHKIPGKGINLPKGKSFEDIQLVPDSHTTTEVLRRADGSGQILPSYLMYYEVVSSSGRVDKMPLENPDGSLARWWPDEPQPEPQPVKLPRKHTDILQDTKTIR